MKATRVSLFTVSLMGAAILATGATTATERFARSGFLKVSKECSGFTGAPGSFCTITSANIPGIPVGAKVYYSHPEQFPGTGLDSNVVLDAGGGNRAVGRCTLDETLQGLCTFSDGTGNLAGFTARVDVTTTDFMTWQWVGTYAFSDLGISWPRPR
jgi:hypothetical protein